MDDKQYKELCEACDHLLLVPEVKMERIAIPWLHVIREHPVFLKNYENIFEDSPISKQVSSLSVRVLFKNFISLTKLVLKKSSWWSVSNQNQNNIDILFVSHLLNDSQSGKETDFYFGDIALKLLEEGISSSFALINHTTQPKENLAIKWKDSIVPRYILSDFLGFTKEVNFYLKSLQESIRLKKYGQNLIPKLFQKVAIKAAHELRLGHAIPSLRIGKQINELTRKLNPRFIITTYEGHAWERIVFAESRNANPDIYCFGYQHAAIFRLQHALKRKLANRFNPNAILCAGLVSFEQLKKTVNLKGIDLSVLGSDRGVRSNKDLNKKEMNSTCLVIPEGSMYECILIFKFSLACAKACTEIEFIWRLHPIISFKEIQKEIEELNDVPENITLSNSLIEEDIKASTCALYRGTTAIIQAINSGLMPLYYDNGEMIIDPIYEVNKKNLYVRNVDDFLKYALDKNFENLHRDEFARIREYSSDFFTPFNHQILLDKIQL